MVIIPSQSEGGVFVASRNGPPPRSVLGSRSSHSVCRGEECKIVSLTGPRVNVSSTMDEISKLDRVAAFLP